MFWTDLIFNFNLLEFVSTNRWNVYAKWAERKANWLYSIPDAYYVRPAEAAPQDLWAAIFGDVYQSYWRMYVWTWEPFHAWMKYGINWVGTAIGSKMVLEAEWFAAFYGWDPRCGDVQYASGIKWLKLMWFLPGWFFWMINAVVRLIALLIHAIILLLASIQQFIIDIITMIKQFIWDYIIWPIIALFWAIIDFFWQLYWAIVNFFWQLYFAIVDFFLQIYWAIVMFIWNFIIYPPIWLIWFIMDLINQIYWAILTFIWDFVIWPILSIFIAIWQFFVWLHLTIQ